ncbi:ejaculatory bulb-specific protein 3 [Cephus cinctus]|uniref:Chemosensory protein 3 n=1 Tax=Cephus cinctus TaxID=211228 RepID=A0A1W6L180_CEPCN|nr:ejaculatory bulb-specific protein 3 [Cephus cinctus]ARN17834.1 chemosensory protein 3 [Cephus cinctus]
MRTQLLLVAVVVGVFALCQAQDISLLLNDRNYVEKQINCVVGKGSCDRIGQQIKVLLPEVLNNQCSRCSPQQAQNARKLVDFMKQRYPNEWRIILKRFSGRQG